MRVIYAMLLAVLISSFGGNANAEELTPYQYPSLHNGTLVVSENRVVLRVPDVPPGLSAYQAHDLVNGKLNEAVVHDDPQSSYSFGYLLLTEKRVSFEKTVTYHNGWVVGPTTSRVVDQSACVVLNLLVWLFAAAVVAAGALNKLHARSAWNLYAFYGAVLGCYAMFVFFGSPFWVLVCTIFVLVTGCLNGPRVDSDSAGLFGIAATAFTLLCFGIIKLTVNRHDAVRFLVFLLAVESVSLLVALSVGFLKDRREKARLFRN